MKLAELPQQAAESVRDKLSATELSLPTFDQQQFARTASQAASTAASQLGERVSDVSERARDLGESVAGNAAQALRQTTAAVSEGATKALEAHASRPRRRLPKHPVRNTLLIAGVGAVAAYFFDPSQGQQRRYRARTRFTSAARTTGKGLDHASGAAHKAADLAQPATTPTQV